MNRKKILISLSILLCISFVGFSQATRVKDFTLQNTVNNQPVSLSDFSGAKGVVVIFTSNYCPYSKLYEDRIEALVKEYSNSSIKFILVNPNNPISSKDDSVEEMAKKAKERNYNFPYLADKNQQVQEMFGATKTPEVFVLKPGVGEFTIVYSGALDDNPQVAEDVSKNYLRDALTALAGNRMPTVKNIRPTGCMIKKG